MLRSERFNYEALQVRGLQAALEFQARKANSFLIHFVGFEA